MSSILPDTRLARVEFFENHNATWNTNAVAIGTTTTEITALTTKTTAARAAYNAQQLAQAQAKAATQAYYAAVAAMTAAGNDILKEIKAKAAVAGDAVYTLALIPPPAVPSPVGPPGQPYQFSAGLDPTGLLTLTWRCDNPAAGQGTIYQVARQVGTGGGGGGAPFVIIGASGDKRFVDGTVPAGSAQVTYRITALRSTVEGTPGEFTVKFGVAAGETTASVVAAAAAPAAPKLAA